MSAGVTAGLAIGASGLLVLLAFWLHARHAAVLDLAAANLAPALRARLDAALDTDLYTTLATAGALLGVMCLAIFRLVRRSTLADQTLLAQRSHLEAAMSAAPLGTWEWIVSTGEVHWSRNVWTMFGLEPDSRPLCFELFRDALHPDDRERVLHALKLALERDEPYEIEARIVRPDGSERWMITQGKVLRDAQGQPERMAGVDLDITARKQLDAARQASDALFAAAFEATVLGMGIVDPEGRWLKVNDALCNLLGLSREALLSTDFQTLTHPDDLAASLALRAQLYAGEIQVLKQEKRYRHRDGHYLWAYVTVGLVRDAGGSPLYHVTQVQDIDARKRAEAALREAHAAVEDSERVKTELLARLNEAQRTARIGSWSWNLASGALWWSDELYRIVGAEPATYTPSADTYLRFVHEEDRASYEALVARTLQDLTGFEYDLRIVTASGELRYCRSRALVECSPAGSPVRVYGSFQDRTEARLLEEQLREAQKMESLGSLAGGIAHDFNNLLAAILGNVALARSKVNDPGAVGDKLARIDEAAQRAKALVDQILSFSRRQPMRLAATDVGALIHEAAALLRATIPAGIDISTHIDDATPPALADPSQLHQIVMNLGTNAWHALRERDRPGGHIELQVYGTSLTGAHARQIDSNLREGHYCCLDVRDNGVGMDAALCERIFEPFFTTRPPGVGTGLGLSVVHGIVAALHGAITVQSTPGVGTCFTLYLPVAGSSVRTAPVASRELPAPKAASERHVLYVDDEPALTALICELLEIDGLQVTTCADAREAIARVREGATAFDLLVTDYNMPGLSGIDLATAVAHSHPHLPVIMSSGYFTPELQQQAAALGVRALVNKADLALQLPQLVHDVIQQVATKQSGH